MIKKNQEDGSKKTGRKDSCPTGIVSMCRGSRIGGWTGKEGKENLSKKLKKKKHPGFAWKQQVWGWGDRSRTNPTVREPGINNGEKETSKEEKGKKEGAKNLGGISEAKMSTSSSSLLCKRPRRRVIHSIRRPGLGGQQGTRKKLCGVWQKGGGLKEFAEKC